MTPEDHTNKHYQKQHDSEHEFVLVNVKELAKNNSNYKPNKPPKASVWRIIKTMIFIICLFCIGVLILGPLFIAALVVIGTVIGMLYLLILIATLTNPDSDSAKDKDANDG
jgi:membrane-bound ClpP family serine protease